MQKGFTLIDLVIVVALIAIIAAIAIPNFITASTRSKVAKVKAEFKAMAAGIEAYKIDANSYPIHISTVYALNGVFGDDAYGSNRYDVLTTPVAYLSSIPRDPFSGKSVPSGAGYFLYCWETFDTWAGNGGPFLTIWHASYWALRSQGPDSVWNSYIPGVGTQLPWYNRSYCVNGDVTLLCYDPTNGLVSYGEIYYTSTKGQY
ncbi:MAG: prepilin-type N-terminal cleavage/methylation domain-containing protein [bacterium]